MPFWERKKTQEDLPEQETAKEKSVPARDNNTVVDKETKLEKKIIEKECQKEIGQLEILGTIQKDPSWDLAVDTLLLCEKNPSDAELIAASIINKRKKRARRFQREHISDNR
jgi:hypothetical protein